MAKQSKNKSENTQNIDWREGFVKFSLENNRLPQSAYELAKFLEVSEESFYENYSTVSALAQEIWKEWFETTKNQVQADEQYQSFSVREKLLAFYYTWFENLKSYRSFIEIAMQTRNLCSQEQYKTFKESFKEFAQELLNEALETNEVQNRNVLNQSYSKILWWQVMYLLNFWLKDTSQGFERTDAAVEKAVNLFFDLAGKTFLDSLVDFAKFNFQK